MLLRTTILAVALIAAGSTMAAAQGGGAGGAGGEPPQASDPNAPGALRNGGIPPAEAQPKILRRDDAMAPLVQEQRFRSRQVSAPRGFGNNPTPTRNDPAGTRTQCRGGCQ